MSALKSLLRLPIDALALFTQAKSFEDNAFIGNRLLNRLGLHVLRVVLAHTAMAIRRTLMAWKLPPEDRKAFARDGFLIKPNFLEHSQFLNLGQDVIKIATDEAPQDSVQGAGYKSSITVSCPATRPTRSAPRIPIPSSRQ